MGKHRKITDELEARACLRAAAESGERLGAWARTHGIDGRSLHAWQMNLSRGSKRRRGGGRSVAKPMTVGPALVEIVPVGAVRGEARYVVHVGAVSIELGDDFREETLRRVLGVLQSC